MFTQANKSFLNITIHSFLPNQIKQVFFHNEEGSSEDKYYIRIVNTDLPKIFTRSCALSTADWLSTIPSRWLAVVRKTVLLAGVNDLKITWCHPAFLVLSCLQKKSTIFLKKRHFKKSNPVRKHLDSDQVTSLPMCLHTFAKEHGFLFNNKWIITTV